MTPTNESPRAAATVAGSTQAQNISAASLAHKSTKLKRVLAELARGRALTRFDAERLGDHVLNSTVDKIQEHGILVSRRWIEVPGYGGHATRCCLYWLDEPNRERAGVLLGWRSWHAQD